VTFVAQMFIKQMGYDWKRLNDFFLEDITIMENSVVEDSDEDSDEEIDYGADNPTRRDKQLEEVKIEKTRTNKKEATKILRPIEVLYNVVKA
jgi:hypothetical protein